MQMKSKRIGDYLLRTPSYGELMKARKEHEGDNQGLNDALLAVCVSNGSGAPIGQEGLSSVPAPCVMAMVQSLGELINQDVEVVDVSGN